MTRNAARSDQVAATQRNSPKPGAPVLTVGHSTREQEDFIALLKVDGVKRLVDVRAIPRSRHNPQFNREQIGPALRRAAIRYLHIPALAKLAQHRETGLSKEPYKRAAHGMH